MTQESCQGGSCSPGSQSQESALDQGVVDALDRIRFKLLVMSGKGGVGKSTVSMYLALGLAARGYKVGLLDIDFHGPSLPRMLGVKQAAEVEEEKQIIRPVILDHGMKALSIEMLMPNRENSVIWRGPLKISVIKQFVGQVAWGDLDFLVIDSPPGTGDEPLTVAQIIDQAVAVVVTTPQEIALADVRKSLDFCRQVEMPILGLVENMSGLTCPHCGEHIDLFGSGGGRALADTFGLNLLARIPYDPRLVPASDAGKPLDLEADYNQAGPAYRDLVDEVVKLTVDRAKEMRPGKSA